MSLTDDEAQRADERRWLAGLAEFDAVNERLLLGALAYLGLPASYLDLGCGTGAMVTLARRLGVDAWGVDILPHAEPWLLRRDLRQPLDLGRTFELVSTIEVAEHIPVENDATFVETVARHVAPGGTLLFTAAHPGQGGDGHVNCRPGVYWRARLSEWGLSYSSDLTYGLMHLWTVIPHAMGHLMDNLQVFKK